MSAFGALMLSTLALGTAFAQTPDQAPMYGAFGLDATGVRSSVAPGDDFFAHTNANWADQTEIPATGASVGTFPGLAQRASGRTLNLIRAAAAGELEGEKARKIGAFFQALMDEDVIEQRGLSPLRPTLARIAAIDNRTALSREIGATIRADVDTINTADQYTERPFGVLVAQDFDEPDRYAPYLMQGGLTMPDRDYYLLDEPRFADLRAKLQAHIAATLNLAGIDDADRRARDVLALETQIAQSHRSAEDTADLRQGNNTWSRAEFDTMAPGFDWQAFMNGAGLDGQEVFKVWQPEAVIGMSSLARSEPLEIWKSYLAFHAIERSSSVLPAAFVDQRFSFHGTAMNGTTAQPPRESRAASMTGAALRDLVGELYVTRHFSPEAKAQVEEIAANVKAALDARIASLDWMSSETKASARAKLRAMRIAIGYPPRWRDYDGLEVSRDDAFGNAERASLYEYRRQLSRLGQPVDRDEWFMSAATASGLNAPSQNSNQFPAAILEPPLFDPLADPAINYGAIGAVIGHELVHGFDNMGSQFDAAGQMRNWWTPEDLEKFESLSARLVSQYAAYQPLPDLPLNGQQTLSENTADLGGLAAALDAYRMSLNGETAPTINGFTGEQRFFLGWAQAFRSKQRDSVLRRQVMTDEHAPARYRVATVRNIDAWYAAFFVKSGHAMYLPPEARIEIW